MKTEAEFIKLLSTTPPVLCEFKVGDSVTFTSEYGVSFPGRIVIGFAADTSFNGRFIHLNGNTPYWFPVRPDQLNLEVTS